MTTRIGSEAKRRPRISVALRRWARRRGRSTVTDWTGAGTARRTLLLLLERGNISASGYPRGTRWTGVWVNDPDAWYRRLRAMQVDAAPPEDEPGGVRLVKVTDPEGHVWALIKRSDR